MIFSKLNTNDTYVAYPTAIQKALEFLRTIDIMSLGLGRHEIYGDKMFANVMNMTTHAYDGSHPEVHQKYIDLMYWPEGGERIGVAPYQGTEAIYESHPENDIALLEDVENENILVATEGCFGIFFPWDAHRPALYLEDGPATSRKVVIKISMDLI